MHPKSKIRVAKRVNLIGSMIRQEEGCQMEHYFWSHVLDRKVCTLVVAIVSMPSYLWHFRKLPSGVATQCVHLPTSLS
jgi:hypothetical protein